jgi:hypothetical protein
MERSTMIFLPGVRQVTRMEARPLGTWSFMPKVDRVLADRVAVSVCVWPPPSGRYETRTVTLVLFGFCTVVQVSCPFEVSPSGRNQVVCGLVDADRVVARLP